MNSEAGVGRDLVLLFAGAIITWLFGFLNDLRKAKSTRKAKLNLLLAEILDNRTLLQMPIMAGGRAKARLRSEAWHRAGEIIHSVPDELVGSLRKTFVEISKYNDLVDYDLNHGGVGAGHFDSGLEAIRGNLNALLGEAESKLSSYLNK